MFTLIQLFGLVFLLVMLGLITLEIKRKRSDFFKLLMVVVILILIGLILLQNQIKGLVTILGFLRPFELFLTIAVIGALVFSFVGYIKQKQNESDITKLVQNIGLKEWKEKKR